MSENSVLLQFLYRIPPVILNSGSASYLRKIGAFLGALLRNCFIVRIFRRFYKLNGVGKRSKFYNILCEIKNRFEGLFRLTYESSKGGLIFKSCKLFFKTSKIFDTVNLLAILFFVVFLCPHSIWNNIFGLLAALIAAVCYMVGVFRGKGFRTSIKGIPFSMILFVFASMLSVFCSIFVTDSLRVFIFFITSFLLCLEFCGVLTSLERFDKILLSIYITVFLTGIIAVAQRVIGIAADPSLTDMMLNSNMPGRAFATLSNPNNYAEFLLLFLPFCFAFAVTRKNKRHKEMYLGGLIVPLAALLLTYSRSGWLGFAVAVVVFVALYDKKMIPVLLFLGICLIPMLPASILNRILTIGNLQDSSSAYRIDIWTGTFALLGQFWMFGTGLGPAAFRAVYAGYALDSARLAPHTHMHFLEILTEMGVLGLIVFTCFIVSLVVVSCRSALKAAQDSPVRVYVIAASASMAGILTIGFFEYIWFYPRVMFGFFIAVGIAIAAIKLSKNNALQERAV